MNIDLITIFYHQSSVKIQINMIVNRAKNCKSETPTRNIPLTQKLVPGLGITKKNGPLLKRLSEISNKENINPNLRQSRVKSQYLTSNILQKSPKKQTYLVYPNKKDVQRLINKPNGQPENMISNSKLNLSVDQQTLAHITKHSTYKDEGFAQNFGEQYYSNKEERKDKKMRVTLKDLKKHRKSVQQSEQDYSNKAQEQTKDSFSKDLLNSLKISDKKQCIGQTSKSRIEDNDISQFLVVEVLRCDKHPQKKATHCLLERDNNVVLCQKCAINLITKGHKMQQLYNTAQGSLNQDNLKQIRFERLKGFLHEVEKLEPTIKQTWVDIANYKVLIQNKFKEQTKQMILYYNRIRNQVEQSYSKSQMNLKIYFESIVQEIQKNEDVLNKNQELLKEYKWDILPNISSIVEVQRVTHQNFNQIIRNYFKNLETIQLSLKDIASYSYCVYQYQYDLNKLRLPGLKEILSPQIKMLTLRQKQNQHKPSNENSIQKRMDPFRLSFGKKMSEVSQRIL